MDAVQQANRHAEVIQTKAFTAWVNSHLRRMGHPDIQDLLVDLQDGVVLCHLVGHLTKQKVRGFTIKPKTHAHKLANISLALDTAEAVGVRLEAFGPQDVYDMNTKLVLGFIWTLIVRYGAQVGAGGTQGTQQRLEQLAGCPVANLTSAWSDGVLLARIINNKRPGLINPDTLDTSRGQDNVGNCLHLLETQFRMPHVLDASDIANTPDEKAMVTFLPYVIEAIEGRSLVADVDSGPAVFNRGSSPSSNVVVTSVPVHTAPSPSRAPAPLSPGRGGSQQPAKSWAVRSPAAPAPAATFSPPRAAGPRSAPSRDFQSKLCRLKHPGISFQAVNVDGRSAEGQSPCQQCGGELGNGRCFRFNNPDTHYIHSRCFDCSVCRKDFISGQFYLNNQNRLLCVNHAMEERGFVCKACNEPIVDFYINALESNWHEDCFRCHGSCHKPFVEPKFFNGNGYPYCDTCFATFNGRVCARCGQGVPNPLKAMDKYWHDQCFACYTCNGVIAGNFVEIDGAPHHKECAEGGSSRPAAAAAAPRPASPRSAPPSSSTYPASSSHHAADTWTPPAPSAGAPVASSQRAPAGSACPKCHQDIPQGEAVTVNKERYHRSCFICFKCNTAIKGPFYTLKEGFCCPACEKTLPPEVEGGNFPCHKCGKVLVGSVIKALGHEYHKECFGCAVCNTPLSGSFFTSNGKPVCQNHAQ